MICSYIGMLKKGRQGILLHQGRKCTQQTAYKGKINEQTLGSALNFSVTHFTWTEVVLVIFYEENMINICKLMSKMHIECIAFPYL